ncbi:MAG: MBL fold metallo-hydrolase [bacterium]|nr:MBL fold metallo-hydrolase [bacterium]
MQKGLAKNKQSRHGFVIDPGSESKKLIRIIEQNNWTIEKILLTHGHFDHLGAVNGLRERYHIPVYAYTGADRYLLDTAMNLSQPCRLSITVKADHYLQDGETIALEANPSFTLQTIYTPGHTADSCVYYSRRDHVAFVGDTIFKGGIGSYGYPGGDKTALIRSVLNKILSLPKETVFYSGHSEPSTIGTERRNYGL